MGKCILKTVRRILLAAVFLIFAAAFNSCVPLAIGAVGIAAGYIARDEGFGQPKPLGSDHYETATEHSPSPAVDGGNTDMPVY